MLNEYLTIKKQGENEINIERSRFIAHIKRTETEEEAAAFIQEIKKKHSSANHNCSAYLIGEHDQIQKANDDGEPAGTAGVPMLEVLKKRKLKDVTVVVTRYFGGIKLGAGGLIRAYGKAVSEGLNAIGIVKRKWTQIVETEVDYTWLGTIEQQLRQSSYTLKEIQYEENVRIYTYVTSQETASFVDWMTNLTNGRAQITLKESIYVESDYQ